MATDDRESRGKSRLWSLLDRVTTIAVLVAAIVFVWNSQSSSRSLSTGRSILPIPKEPIPLEGMPTMGSPVAKVALVEFSDFQCPFCAKFASETLPKLKAKYVDTGLLRFVFRHNPIPVHPRAQAAAEAAECAGRQGHFWEMHHRLFEDPKRLEESNLAEYAQGVGLDLSAFDLCSSWQGLECRQFLKTMPSQSLSVGSDMGRSVKLERLSVGTSLTTRHPCDVR